MSTSSHILCSMKPFCRLVITVFLFVACSLPREGKREHKEPQDVVVPTFSVSDMPLSEAVVTINELSANLFSGVPRVRLVEDPNQLTGFKYQVLPKPVPGDQVISNRRISLEITNCPLTVLLEAVSRQSQATLIKMADSNYWLIPKVWSNEPHFEKEYLTGSKFGGSDFPIDYRSELATFGVVFYEGGSALLYPNTGRLLIVSNQSQFDLLDGIVD